MSNVVRLSAEAYDALTDVKESQGLATISDAVLWIIRERNLEQLFQRVDRLEKQIALLLQQQGGAGEGDPTRD